VLGSPARIPPLDADRLVASLDVAKVVPCKSVDPAVLDYRFRAPDYRDWVAAQATGTTVRRVRPADVLKLRIALPSITEQRGIVAVLGAFDDKIECNRRVAAAAEKLAAALFRSWFIDFDPI